MWTKLFLLSAVVVLFTACHSKKKAAQITAPIDIPSLDLSLESHASASLLASNLEFQTFSGRASTALQFGRSTYDVTSNIRIQKDRKIWILMTATLGVEVARVLITPDSIQVLNKMQGEYIARPFSYIHQFSNRELTFQHIQDLLLGNLSANFLGSKDVQIASSEKDIQILGKRRDLTFFYLLNALKKPTELRLEDTQQKQKLFASYSSYGEISGFIFPQKIALHILGTDIELTADLSYNKVVFNQELEMPFTVNARYKVIK